MAEVSDRVSTKSDPFDEVIQDVFGKSQTNS